MNPKILIKQNLANKKRSAQELADSIATTPLTKGNKKKLLKKIAEFEALIEEATAVHDSNLEEFKTDRYCFDKLRLGYRVEYVKVRALKL